MQRYYLTTPIYYVNDEPHLGHIYTTIAADVLARYQRMAGKDVFFLTGTDEHGLKVQQAAERLGISPLNLADRIVQRYRSLWPLFSISNDDFIRTSEERHKHAVQAFWRKLDEAGDIYKGVYEDWYCIPCESYWTETQIRDAGLWPERLCPDCRRPVERVEEESYFFRLSRYQDRLLAHIHENPDFIGPESRRNEVLQFVASGLKDLSISRTTFTWGVPVPGDPSHVVYVWVDALTNYLSALGYPNGERMRYWPANLHLIGKDILRFHAVYWPCMLMAVDLPLPERIFAHGWWTVEGKKMSKSLGNVVRPQELLAEWEADVIRYFLLREVPFGQDGDFSHKSLSQRYNTELANDLGNLLNRTLAMLQRYRQGRLTKPSRMTHDDRQLIASVEQMQCAVMKAMEKQAFHEALLAIAEVIRHGNRYVEDQAPWRLYKEGAIERLDCVLYMLVETIRLIGVQLAPFMPNKASLMLSQVHGGPLEVDRLSFREHGGWGLLADGHVCATPSPVFPKNN